MLLIVTSFFKIPRWSLLVHFLQVQVVRPFDTELLHWQWISLLICLLVCLNPWIIPSRALIWLRMQTHRFALGRFRAMLTCALFPVVVRIVLLPVAPFKPPSVHDEFSLLLMADTFCHGRLTNPTHPLWTHFETIHEIQTPTYNSMYGPGFGAFLALGQLLHSPWIGVLLTIGLMCGALCWMLQAWLPPTWAFGCALLASIQIAVGSYWMNSLVGGAPVPAMAGALLLGAVPPFLKAPRASLGVVFATGIVLLMNTRPFEGSMLSIGACGLAVFLYRKSVFGHPSINWKVFVPGAIVLALGGAFTAYYSWRVTGNPLKMPYVVNRDTYGWPENLAILPAQKLTYRHKILQNMHELELSRRSRYSTLGRMLDTWSARASILWEFYVGPGLTLALLMTRTVLRSPKLRPLFYLGVFMLSLNILQLMAYPQHVSQEAAIFYLVVGVGLRHLYVATKHWGLLPERLMAAIVLCVASGAFLNLFMDSLDIRPGSFWEWPHWQFYEARASVAAKLAQMPGKHLMIVKYSDTHSPHEEWVYNAADIDESKVVWANAMGRTADHDLCAYFHDRHVWIIEPDKDQYGFFPLNAGTYPDWSIWQSTKSQSLQPRSSIPR